MITVCKLDAAQVLKSLVDDAACVRAIIVFALLYLEQVVVGVLILAVSVGLVVDELAVVLASVQELHLAPADSLVIGPGALVELTVWVVANALAVTSMVAVDSFVVAAVLEHDLDSSVGYEPLLKASLHDLVLARVEYSVAMRLIVFEVSFVKCPTIEHADAMPASGIVLELPFVEVTVLHFHYSVAVSLVLRVGSNVLSFLELLDFLEVFHAVVDEGEVGSVDALLDGFGHPQGVLDLERWLLVVACLHHQLGVGWNLGAGSLLVFDLDLELLEGLGRRLLGLDLQVGLQVEFGAGVLAQEGLADARVGLNLLRYLGFFDLTDGVKASGQR